MRLDDYLVVDWHSRYQVHERAALTLNVDNIFDTDYRDFPGFDQPGITVLGGVEVMF